MLASTLAQIFEDILFELDELVSLGLEVHHDVALVGTSFVRRE